MLFLALVTGHFIGDFVLQSGFKEDRNSRHLARHFAVFVAVFSVCLWVLEQGTSAGLTVAAMAFGSSFLALMHVLQDAGITRLSKQSGWSISDPLLFIADQSVHLAVLLAGGFVITQATSMSVVVTSGQGFDASRAILASALLLTLGTGVSAVVLAHFLAPFKEAVDAEAEGPTVPSAGLWIGIFERLILMIVIAAGTEVFSSVGLLMGVKSVFRFRELDKRASAEYYLLGSLMSICIGVLIGLGLRWLWTAKSPGSVLQV